MLLLQNLVDGLLLGAFFGLITLGITLAFGTMGIINVLHLDTMVLGCYIIYFLTLAGIPFIISSLISVPIIFALGLLIEIVGIERLARNTQTKGEFVRISLPFAFGIAFMIRFSMTEFIGGDYISLGVGLRELSWKLGGVTIAGPRLAAASIAVATGMFLWMFLTKTKTGLEIMAISEDTELSQYAGINIKKIRLIGYSLSLALAAVASIGFIILYSFYPAAGAILIPVCFCITVAGGLGCLEGTMIIGLLFGVVISIAGGLYSMTLGYILVFLLMLVVLLVKPRGILGRGGKI